MKILVDDEDQATLAMVAWKPHARGSKYFKAKIGGKMVYLHRKIVGAESGQIVDHINGNPLDCRRQNLRICDYSQSNSNRAARKDSRAPYKGITLTSSGRWLAQIMHRKQYTRIGLFNTPEEASAAYRAEARRLHGEYANFTTGRR